MSADVPSSTALATSDASARVGSGWRIIDSSICVAVITVLPASRPARITCFCTSGTSAAPISTPRSPRATISTSLASTTASRCSSASPFSILAMIRARDPVAAMRSRRSWMSSGRRTNESAM